MALTNSSGQIVEAYDNDAYGSTLIFTAPGSEGASLGRYVSGGAAAGGPGAAVGYPSQTGQPVAVGGAYAGLGYGIFVTNAGSVSQLAGSFWGWNLDIMGFGSVALEYSGGVWICSISDGPAIGAAGSGYPTTTKVTGKCQLPNVFDDPAGYVTDVNGNLQVVPP